MRQRLVLLAVGGALLVALFAGWTSVTGKKSSGERIWSAEHGHYHDANGVAIP